MSDSISTAGQRNYWRPIGLAAGFSYAAGFALLLGEMPLAGAALGAMLIAGAGAGLAALFLAWDLNRKNARVRNAIDNMSQGLCMFGPDEKLIVSNRKYIEMYELSAKVVRPGIKFKQLLEHRKASGHFARDIGEYRNALISAVRGGKTTTAEVRSPGGQLICVNNRPMPDGGWVGTHEDITERREIESERDAMQQYGKRRAEIDAAISAFRAHVESHLHLVGDSAAAMRTTADGLLNSSGQTAERAQSAVAASNEASTSVETAAIAAEELNGSINEISMQIRNSAEVVAKAVTESRATNEEIGVLAQAAAKIGDVVKLIRAIAGQTNLLALNATIEAARAGEAGKGFAVVASEVKTLAVQTAKATEEISGQIATVQAAAQQAVGAIARISTRMQEIDSVASAVDASVHQQNAATGEISNNVLSAAQGTKSVLNELSAVADAAAQTRQAAENVLKDSRAVEVAAGELRGEVEGFLSKVAV